MILRGTMGARRAVVRMDFIKPNDGNASLADRFRDLAEIVALPPEIATKKTRAEVSKAPLTNGRLSGK